MFRFLSFNTGDNKRRMLDVLSVLGLITGIAAIIIGNLLEGGQTSSLVNIPALVVVFGGTLGASLLQFPPTVFFRSMRMLFSVFVPRIYDAQAQIDQIVGWSQLARRDGLLKLEDEILEIDEPFTQKGLQLLVDGNNPESILTILELDIGIKENLDYQAAKLFEAMGGYAPTIGILGAVMGLIHVMQNLANPELLGAGIATAFVATIYGVASANLIFLPIASKLKMHIASATQLQELIATGLVEIAKGENPKNIELKLSGYLDTSHITS